MIKLKIGRIQQIIMVFVWALILFIPLMFRDNRDEINWDHLLRIWIEYGIVFIIFIFNRMVLLPQLFFKNKRLIYFLSLGGIILVFITSIYLREGHRRNHRADKPGFEHAERPGPPPGERPPRNINETRMDRPPKDFTPPYANLMVLTILLLGFDSGLIFSTKWLESEQSKIKLEKENVENKMAFLQNQISPHFFMNTLNNIHALVDIDTEEAKASIIKLSQMMGYMLYESKIERVPLQKEMEFISSYIELMRIRFTDEVKIELDIPEQLPLVHVPPLLTISFIENAFKHGISYNEPCFIRISFSFEKERMTFDIINKVFEKKVASSHSGVGVVNAKNRLELIYGKAYNLEIGELPEKLFAVNLNVPL
ncbi:sensor histidine kinase [Labilibacter marinus]|uniref:sensor histidine kinase n=1 Tax=Labilibacter marinus TaxID=1477105 RepID=UPI00094F656F|nr:histidine kinase [Labilibacter marinus]